MEVRQENGGVSSFIEKEKTFTANLFASVSEEFWHCGRSSWVAAIVFFLNEQSLFLAGCHIYIRSCQQFFIAHWLVHLLCPVTSTQLGVWQDGFAWSHDPCKVNTGRSKLSELCVTTSASHAAGLLLANCWARPARRKAITMTDLSCKNPKLSFAELYDDG